MPAITLSKQAVIVSIKMAVGYYRPNVSEVTLKNKGTIDKFQATTMQ